MAYRYRYYGKDEHPFRKFMLKLLFIILIVGGLMCYFLPDLSKAIVRSAEKSLTEKITGEDKDSTKNQTTKRDSAFVHRQPIQQDEHVQQPIAEIKDETEIPVGSVEVPIEIDKSMKQMWIVVNVNGYPIKLLIDTGCSDVLLDAPEFLYLKRMGVISNKDFKGNCIGTGYRGEEHTLPSYNIKTIELGGIEIHNVVSRVLDESNENTCGLLGMDVLGQFGTFMIDYKNQKLYIKRDK